MVPEDSSALTPSEHPNVFFHSNIRRATVSKYFIYVSFSIQTLQATAPLNVVLSVLITGKPLSISSMRSQRGLRHYSRTGMRVYMCRPNLLHLMYLVKLLSHSLIRFLWAAEACRGPRRGISIPGMQPSNITRRQSSFPRLNVLSFPRIHKILSILGHPQSSLIIEDDQLLKSIAGFMIIFTTVVLQSILSLFKATARPLPFIYALIPQCGTFSFLISWRLYFE